MRGARRAALMESAASAPVEECRSCCREEETGPLFASAKLQVCS